MNKLASVCILLTLKALSLSKSCKATVQTYDLSFFLQLHFQIQCFLTQLQRLHSKLNLEAIVRLTIQKKIFPSDILIITLYVLLIKNSICLSTALPFETDLGAGLAMGLSQML